MVRERPGRRTPADRRAADGRLQPCPSSPNCVCSEAPRGGVGASSGSDARHAIAPLAFRGPAGAAWMALAALLGEQPRASVVLATPDYLHAEFRSRVFRFVDDVEFRLDAAAGVIQLRSAARLGYFDLGTNRRRIEALRAVFAQRLGLGAGVAG